jgi:hypothetical protein
VRQPIFGRASDFLAERLQTIGGLRRVGILARASIEGVLDAGKRLEALFDGAGGHLDAAIARSLEELADPHQRSVVRFEFSVCSPIPVDEQLAMLSAARGNESVSLSAAKQHHVPVEVQRFIVKERASHRQALLALARNPRSDLQALSPLLFHDDRAVRLALAEHVGPRMRLDEKSRDVSVKHQIYNALVQLYEADFAHSLVPVCRDSEALDSMYRRSVRDIPVLQLFVENPFTPDDVLLDIATNRDLGRTAEGAEISALAKSRVEAELSRRDEAGLTYN